MKQSRRILSLLIPLLILLIASACITDDPHQPSGAETDDTEADTIDDPEPDPIDSSHAIPRVEYQKDGIVVLDDQRFDSVEDFHNSDEFLEGGHRCATEYGINPELLLSDGDSTDCTFNFTSIDPAYDPDSVYEIPVVFHVIEQTNGTGHIPEDQIHSQMEILNEDFRALANSPGAPGEDSRIEFVLADEDPQGNPTSGINYHTNNQWFSDPGPGQTSNMKQSLNWDPDHYLNIYTNDASGALGYATFPQQAAGGANDGVVLLWNTVGRNAPGGGNFDQGRTATHEVGHYFGLFHTFQDACQSSQDPYSTGDRIADTPSHQTPDNQCQTRSTSCGTGTSPIHNYMNYSPDTCMHEFTPEQINRMRCSIVNYRADLVRLANDDPPSTTPDPAQGPEAEFAVHDEGLNISIDDLSSGGDAPIVDWEWDFGDGHTSTDPAPTHTYATAGTYSIGLVVTDSEGLEDSTATNITVEQPASEGGELVSGELQTGLAGGSGDEIHFSIDLPPDTTDLQVEMMGGTGDADLYVRHGQPPTESDWDCRPYVAGNDESCAFESPDSGSWYVMVRGYQAFDGVDLVATYSTSPPPSATPPEEEEQENEEDGEEPEDEGDESAEDEEQPPGADDDALQNGVPVTGLSGDAGDELHYSIDVPPNASILDVEMSGGTGDADLYVRHDQPPTSSNWDCRPYIGGNDEECSFDDPDGGTWHIMIRGFQAFDGVELVASHDGDSTPPTSPPDDEGDDDPQEESDADDNGTEITETDLSAPTGDELHYSVEVPTGVNELTFQTTGGTGDVDLYVRQGATPTQWNYDYRPYLVGNEETVTVDDPEADTWYIMLHAYESFDGVTFSISYE